MTEGFKCNPLPFKFVSMSKDEIPELFFDGGSRGNPGIAGSGAILKIGDATIKTFAKRLPKRATNNEAEYGGMIIGLRGALDLGYRRLRIYGDSLLVVNQVLGLWRVKHPRMKTLHKEAMLLLDQLDMYGIHHIPREQNKEADFLANEAMDGRETV